MKTVTLEVCAIDDVKRRFVQAFSGKEQGVLISFESSAALWKALSVKRWQLIEALTGAGPVTIREAARRVQRDVKAVHGDIHALLNAGLLAKTADGKIVFPYDAIHVDFMVKAA
jgi:predicted transcriptional regulator